jgi:hypothetical protein
MKLLFALCLLFLSSCYRQFVFDHKTKKWDMYMGRGKPFRSKKHPRRAKHIPNPYYMKIKEK